MKKIILLAVVAFSMFSASAQTKKSKNNKKVSNKEAVAKAKYNKQEAQKKLMRDSLIIGLNYNDSLRLAADSVSDFQKDSMSIAYKQEGLKMIDSANAVKYAGFIADKSMADKTNEHQLLINQAAKLTAYQSSQVKFINETYNEKARVIMLNTDTQIKQTELVKLNEERKAKIRVVVGKAKEKKIESERKDFVKKNGVDTLMEWIDMAESVATK